MKFLQVIITLLSIIFASSCDQKLCLSSPPRYNFAFVNSQDQSIVNDSSQAAMLRLIYISPTGARTIVPQAEFKPVASNDNYKFIYNMLYDLFAKSEQIQYAVEIDNKVVGNLALISRMNSSKCNPWMNLSEVRFNNLQVRLNADNVTYVVKINL